MDATALFRWVAPDGGPAATAGKLAEWASANLQDAALIMCNPRDLDALRGTLLGERVTLPGRTGIVQPGTLWVPAAASAEAV